jgi:hypothetical protein
MNKLAIKRCRSKAVAVLTSRTVLAVKLDDGRTIFVPLIWFPRLKHATARERKKWRLIGNGRGIYWPDLDEDISVRNLLAGIPSGESQASFRKWLRHRKERRRPVIRKKL